MKEEIKKAKELIEKSEKIVILTGAGVSAESGIPTFRGSKGLWNNFNVEELATLRGFLKNPKLVWQWYNERRKNILNSKPNLAHLKLAQLEKIKPNTWIITQNVDGLHYKAGSKNVIEFHGNIFSEKCLTCDYSRKQEVYYEDSDLPLLCPRCGNLLRPDVVWFEEPIAPENIEKSFELVKECDLFMFIGTSAVVYPAAYLIELALKQEKQIIEINLEPTYYTGLFEITLLGKASHLLDEII